MIPISDFEEVLLYLEKDYLLCCGTGSGKVFIRRREDGTLRIKGQNASYTLTAEDFEKLYSNSLFYRTDFKEESLIDETKDEEEYYRWEHK
ncbi:MAG: hypothetical protein IIZ61_02495 [Lachnospiraceae bacterium]|nr:hypothetical protein [Lachnospiraceae bacterium]